MCILRKQKYTFSENYGWMISNIHNALEEVKHHFFVGFSKKIEFTTNSLPFQHIKTSILNTNHPKRSSSSTSDCTQLLHMFLTKPKVVTKVIC